VLHEVFEGAVAFAAPDELADALGHPSEGRRAAGRALAAGYTWAEAARRHLALYRTLALRWSRTGNRGQLGRVPEV
jgi:hypothetical protein